jgi:iron-sulfur cluster repair protein YtfE (RIC family)
MDAISLLKADHKKVGELLDKVEALSDGAHVSRQRLFEQIAQELTVHAQVEETIFYPAVKARTKRDTEPSDEVLEAYEEHANVKSMLEKLRALDPAEETYNAKLQVLSDLVRHHVKEEETVLFKQARELLDKSELEELGGELAAAKEEMLQATM